jgi:enoyl-CoA hydratase
MAATPGEDVVIWREGRAGRITMNRPQALNALTYPMVGRIARALDAWRHDRSVELVILDGAGGRALCAGGDVRGLFESRKEGSGLARAFWREEYTLNAAIARFPKPFIAIMDGIVMGGGIGLSAHASHRVVSERSELAMPETGIGLIPDVGGTWLLSRAPRAGLAREAGTYLALTGQRFDGAAAMLLGFADARVEAARLAQLAAALVAGGDVGASIDAAASEPGKPAPHELREEAPAIDAAFAADRVEDIVAALESMPGEFARQTLARLAPKSPLSLKLTLAALRRARRARSLEEALNVEYRLTVRLFEHGEFAEGVRALLIDKDRSPRWRPPRLEDVTAPMLEAFLAPLPPGQELDLKAPAGGEA